MLKGMIIDNDNIIIDNNSNFFTDGLDNKNLKKEKRNESINMAIII